MYTIVYKRGDDMREEGRRKRGGAQTFRRGRALMFYQQLEVKRDTLKKQLESNTLESIHPVIAGELKATETIMEEFKVIFALDEMEQRE